ncbi:hypothetical protein A8146_26235 [Mesorhizobium loti]|nr:hypothetical protein A8146_26235 [Mesorhizobium loti]
MSGAPIFVKTWRGQHAGLSNWQDWQGGYSKPSRPASPPTAWRAWWAGLLQGRLQPRCGGRPAAGAA